MKEQISALLDGELDPSGVQALVSHAKTESALRECWDTYALIGDALRGEADMSRDFTARLMARLDAEPTVIAPAASVALAKSRRSVLDTVLPIAATVAGVAVVAWLGLRGEPVETTQVARATHATRAVPAAEADRAYLLAHHGYAGAQAVPGVGYYMRTAAEQVGDGVR